MHAVSTEAAVREALKTRLPRSAVQSQGLSRQSSQGDGVPDGDSRSKLIPPQPDTVDERRTTQARDCCSCTLCNRRNGQVVKLQLRRGRG